MAPTYKLTYFPVKALAEPARLIFAFTNTPYEDIRLEKATWPEHKPKYEWGTLPVLEVDGKSLSQSHAILRYLGKQFNLAGENDFESAKCDEMVEAMADLKAAAFKYFFESDEDKKKEIGKTLLGETFPKFLGIWEKILSDNGTGFLVGKKFSYADFCVASYLQIYRDTLGDSLLDKYPAIQAHQEKVFNSPGVKQWVENRPKTPW